MVDNLGADPERTLSQLKILALGKQEIEHSKSRDADAVLVAPDRLDDMSSDAHWHISCLENKSRIMSQSLTT